jgi:hypothetical protein
MVEAGIPPRYHFKEQTARSLYAPYRRHPPYLQLNPLTGLFTWETGKHNACQPVAPKERQFFRS